MMFPVPPGMTVGQLCDALDGMDSDTLVVLAIGAADAEILQGQLRSVDTKCYVWQYDHIAVRYLSAEMRERGHTIDQVGDGDPCVVLWSVA